MLTIFHKFEYCFQVEDYAWRKGMEVSKVEEWLDVNLSYDN